MQLPCKHILAVRMSHSLSEYDESLCAERWKLQHFLSNHRAYMYLPNDSSGNDADSINISTHIFEPASAVLSEQQKYRKAFKVAQNLCQQLSTFGMRDFNEGIEVLQSVASLWDGGKKVFVWEATGTTTVQYTVHYVTVIVFVTLHYVVVILYFSNCTDTDDEVLSEGDDESESDTHIKVPPPPPPTDRGTNESDSNRTSSSDANKGTLHPIYCTWLPSNHSLKQTTS